MNPGQALTGSIYLFILILIRYTGLFLITPVLGSRTIPTRVKIGIAFFLALITIPILLQTQQVGFPEHVLLIGLTVIKELAVGLMIGFLTYIIFAAFQLAGQFIDLRMGFRMANIVDPMRGTSSPLMGQFQNILATLIFFAINGHHMLIRALFDSFRVIPVGGTAVSGRVWEFLLRRAGNIFLIAFKVSLPIIGTIFIADIIFAFLARSVPQMNIFIVGFPVKILLGFLFFILSVHVILHYFGDLFNQLFKDIATLLKLLGPP